ncbi:hypothetical protein HAX54_033454, partial [Datura stramonium]|nr:hypothetical protein [Datura stramonium]
MGVGEMATALTPRHIGSSQIEIYDSPIYRQYKTFYSSSVPIMGGSLAVRGQPPA